MLIFIDLIRILNIIKLSLKVEQCNEKKQGGSWKSGATAAFANLFNEKGYDNIFLISGGIEQFNEEFHHMVEGRDVPKPKCEVIAEEQKRREDKSDQIKAR